MSQHSERYLKTGSDPRTLSDYAALRDELAKLSHPARPDVNWRYVEKLCLSLFDQNGVELQTAAWYTLVRTHQAGLFGLNEGLSILEALVSHQWSTLWPQPIHARMEILSSLSQRIQQLMRTLPLNYSDLSQLYQAEQQLTRLGTVLQRLELKHLSQLETLRSLMHASAVRLENSHGIPGTNSVIQTGVVLPAEAVSSHWVTDKNASVNRAQWIYVAQSEHQKNVDVLAVTPVAPQRGRYFAAGMGSMLVVSAAMTWGWHLLHRPDPLQTQLVASLAPLPSTLSSPQLAVLRQQAPAAPHLIVETEQQLARLEQLPPDWNIHYRRQLIEQARTLWPEQAKPLVQQWRQQLNAVTVPTEKVNGWHQGMATLQQLTDKLNALDEKRGKYMTVSELKSAAFNMMTHFRQTVPLEEELRLIHLQAHDSPNRQQYIQQAEQHLRAQTYMLMQEKERYSAAK